MGLSVFEERDPFILNRVILAADTPESQSLGSASERILRIDRIIVATDDTADVLVQLVLADSYGTLATLGSLTLHAGAGTDPAFPSVNLLEAAGLQESGVALQPAAYLAINVPVALTSGATLWVASLGGYL